MDSLRYVILLVALLAAGVAGYFVGARSGQDAKEALARLEAAGKEGDAEGRKTKAELESKLATLNARYEAEKTRIDSELAISHDKLAALLAARDKTIGDLKARSASDQSEIRQLRLTLVDAKNPGDKQATLERIARLEDDAHAALVDARGNQCLKVPVPKAILETLLEPKP